ncbi:MAG TPA: exosortase/archaeosortase family protein [Planctomycetaceae bacterium]|nr:exosortase/archaeosortase family protein [Planctomycetaceae bacterium]
MSTERISEPVMHLLDPRLRKAIIAFAVLAAGLVWGYWSTLGVMAQKWAHDPQYSHGWIVPLFSAAFLWIRRDKFPTKVHFSAWGLALLGFSVAVRLTGAFFYFEWFDFLSIVPAVAGLTLLCFGWAVLRWALPSILFLTFMIPLPFTIETAMRGPLRKLGTVASTYVMQTLGMAAFSEGTVIVMDNDIRIGVAEACSGLRMLMIFFALATAVAMLSQRAPWERLVIVLSAVPIALIANVTRITVTGILHATAGSEIADLVFHDLAGWLMMPFGLALLGAELWLLSRLFIVEQEIPLAPLTVSAGARPRPRPATGASEPADPKPRKTGVS